MGMGMGMGRWSMRFGPGVRPGFTLIELVY